MEATKCLHQKVQCLSIVQVVIPDLPGGILIGNHVRWIGTDQIRLHITHKRMIGIRQGGVSANHAVASQVPDIPGLGEGRLFQFGFNIKIIISNFLVVYLVEQGLNLRRIEASLVQVKIGILNILQQIRFY